MLGLVDDLRQILATKPAGVVFIVGTGASAGALRGSPLVSLGTWAGLLADGLQRAHQLGALDESSLGHYQQQLGLTFPHALLGVADVVAQTLGAPHDGEFSRWLRETVGAFPDGIFDRAVLEVLADHQRRGVLLATTNYDHLLETVTGLRATTWRRPSVVERAIKGIEPRIIHLHGEWEDPESIVLGTRSYVDVTRDPHAQVVLATLRTDRTFVFIGCGAGLKDPNLGAFIKWTGDVFARSEARHFRLCRASEVEALRREHPPEQRIFPLPYGDTHADLAPFLRSLLPISPSTSTAVLSPNASEGPPSTVDTSTTEAQSPNSQDDDSGRLLSAQPPGLQTPESSGRPPAIGHMEEPSTGAEHRPRPRTRHVNRISRWTVLSSSNAWRVMLVVTSSHLLFSLIVGAISGPYQVALECQWGLLWYLALLIYFGWPLVWERDLILDETPLSFVWCFYIENDKKRPQNSRWENYFFTSLMLAVYAFVSVYALAIPLPAAMGTGGSEWRPLLFCAGTQYIAFSVCSWSAMWLLWDSSRETNFRGTSIHLVHFLIFIYVAGSRLVADIHQRHQFDGPLPFVALVVVYGLLVYLIFFLAPRWMLIHHRRAWTTLLIAAYVLSFAFFMINLRASYADVCIYFRFYN